MKLFRAIIAYICNREPSGANTAKPSSAVPGYVIGACTDIKLWSAESIGISEGYFECREEQQAADREFIETWNTPDWDKGTERWKQRCIEIERKYFGPKYIKV